MKAVTDMMVARKFMKLEQSAKARGLDFDLKLVDVRRMLTRKTCAYTGVVLTEPQSASQLPTDRTVDRIDSSRGYVTGNVVAVSFAANQLKEAVLESKTRGFTTDFKTLKKFVKSLDKIGFK